MDPASSSSSKRASEDVEGGAKDDDTLCSSSSAVQWQQQQQKPELHFRANPHLSHIHVLASSNSYNELTQQSQSGSIDCAVSVEVICPGAQTEVKSEAEPQGPPLPPPAPPARKRSRLRCCGITLLVLGLLATSVLVPIAVTVGFKQDIPPVYRVLQQPQPSHRLVFAFQSSALAATAADVLPPHLASQVSSWSALPSSGIHVVAFSDAQALQQALTHLAGAGNTSPSHSLLESGNSSSRAWGLKYALSDFRLVADRQVNQVINPMQLFDMAREQTRTLLQQQQQQQHGVATQPGAAEEDEDVYLSRLEQDAWQQQQQQRRQRLRTAAAEVAASGPVEPLTAAGRTGAAAQQQEQQTRRRRRQLTGHATLNPLSAGLGSPSAAPAAGASNWGSVLRRTLLQAAAKAMPARARPQLQLQQRQAQQQVQRGGSRVAWHLTDAGLGVREAWNITSGFDRVVVAVIDSGVELSSGAVGASLWTNAAEVAADGVDNDGNGYADDAMGWDFGGACADVTCSFCAPGPDPTDSVGWGTHAAAAIAAQPEVASGTAGIAPGVRVMPLKVADCRHGTQLWDVTTQQGGLVKPLDDDSSSSDVQQQQAFRQEAGPTLLGSAAVQALDYALLNGAHIVLAGWSAGQLVDSSSAPQCFMGTAAAAPQGDDAAGCVPAVQRALFLDALKPLQEAGVLVVTMQDSTSAAAGASGTAAAGAGGSAHLPCTLSCELDNVVCVAASTVVLPPNGSRSGLTDVLSAASFFAPLAGQHSSSFVGLVGSTGDEEDMGDGSSRGDGDLHSDAAKPGSGIRLAALSCDAASGSKGAWSQLRAPGTDILAGWSWGSHAVVSGSSAAASVTAGVAALAWSRLGQTLGADASPGAFEGLGQQVKQELLQGSSVSTRSSSSSGPSNSSGSSSSSDASTDASAVDSGSKRSFITGDSSIAGSAADAAAGATLELDLLGALQQGSRAPEVVTLQPAVLDPSVTCAARSLRYTWHIQKDGEGPYDTNAMWYVSRKAVKPPAFPITHWEFTGATAMVELTGYLDVQVPGTYVLAASSEDRFVLWLQDWWLHMQEAEWGYATWTARANFTAPGLYKLRLIVYSPSKTFNLQWLPPRSSSFSPINSFMSLGRSQALPQQLLHSMLLPLAARADSSSERSSRSKQLSPASGEPATDQQHVYVASASSSESAPAGPAPLPDSPGGDSTAAAGSAAAAAAGPAEGAPSTAGSSSGAGTVQAAGWDVQGDASSMSATMEPTESADSSQSTQEPMLAADAATDSTDAVGSGMTAGSTSAVSAYAPGNSGYQLQPAYYTPFLGAAGDATAASSGGDLWSSLRSMFGGGWFGRRRRMSHRRSLLSAGSSNSSSGSQQAYVLVSVSESISRTSSSSSSSSRQDATSTSASIHQHAVRQPETEQQQQRRRLMAAATADHFSGQDLAGKSAGVGSIWGRFTAAVAFADRTQFRTLMPDQTKLSFSHSGILPGPGLFVDGWLQFQETVLGWSDPHDNRGAYGMIQGWLDWRDLNPQSAPSIAAAAAAAARAASDGSLARQRIAAEGSSLGASVGSVSTGAAGVQFELSCDSCSLQIDGLTVAGSLGGAETSSCITPAAVASPLAAKTGSSSSGGGHPVQQQHPLLHLSIMFTTNDNRKARFQVRSRPCNGVNSQAGSGGWLPLTAAGASSPPAFAVTSAAVAGQAGSSQVFTRGMLCAVTVQPPPPAPAAPAAADGASNATATAGSGLLQRLVFLSAAQMRAAITISVNTTADGPAAPPLAAFNGSAGQAGNASSNSTNSTSSVTGSRSRSAAHSITVDVPQGMFAKDDSENEGAPGSDSNNSTMSEEEAAEAAAEAAALQAELQRRAAQTAAAKTAALAEGVSVAELVPDWVSSLPADTTYSFSCGCYWNGSWDGNVSVSVSAAAPGGGGSSGGRAKLFVAGWPVAAKGGRVLGPSDLDVRGYSTVLQRQQLAAGSDSADPLVDAAHVWASGGSFLDASSSGHVGGDKAGASSSSSSAASSGKEVLSAEAIRQRRYARVQQVAASRASSGSSGGSGSSALVGLQPIGRLDGTSRRKIFKRAGQHQLLVLHAEGLTRDDQMVVLAPGDTSSFRSSADGMLAAGGAGGGSKASNGSASVLSSWLPGPWDAWVPAG